jgi:hypothetical protein
LANPQRNPEGISQTVRNTYFLKLFLLISLHHPLGASLENPSKESSNISLRALGKSSEKSLGIPHTTLYNHLYSRTNEALEALCKDLSGDVLTYILEDVPCGCSLRNFLKDFKE